MKRIPLPNKIIILLVLFCLAPLSLAVAPSGGLHPNKEATPIRPPPRLKGNFSPDEILVILHLSASPANISSCLSPIEFSIKSKIEEIQVVRLKIQKGEVAQAIADLQKCKGIADAEPNYIAKIADVIPNDPGWGNQYGLVAIRAPQGWEITRGLSSVTIAIVDTGIQLSHPDLAGKIVPGYDFVNNDSNPNDDNGHGTHVAGIAAAMTNDGIGVAGVSWGARLMPVKVLNASGTGTYADVSQGIIWATNHGAQIINLSLGGSSPSAVLQNAVDYAYSRGVTVVAAAGNSGSNLVLYPAHYPDVIAVAATDQSNNHASFSNYGPEISVAAPGVEIYSTLIGGYGYLSGTSMSTPFVSGLAAILRGIPGNGTPNKIAWDMESTTLDLGAPGPDPYYGYGLIQMDAAIHLAWPPPPSSHANQTGAIPLNLPGSLFNTATLIPTFTATLNSTPRPTETMIGTITISPTTSSSQTPEVSALSNLTPTVSMQSMLSSKLGDDWPVGCWGVILILLGAVLSLFLSRKRSKHYSHKQYLKMR